MGVVAIGRGTCVDGRVMEATTSATHRHQPQATHHWRCLPPSHSSTHTHHSAHSHVSMATERVDEHTVLTITPSIHPNHTLHHQLHAANTLIQPYSCRILLAPLGKMYTSQPTTSALTMYCSACRTRQFVCNHSCLCQ